jgi:hypothetical protein
MSEVGSFFHGNVHRFVENDRRQLAPGVTDFPTPFELPEYPRWHVEGDLLQLYDLALELRQTQGPQVQALGVVVAETCEEEGHNSALLCRRDYAVLIQNKQT